MSNIVGLDIGGTKISCGKVNDNIILKSFKTNIKANGDEKEILKQIKDIIKQIIDPSVSAIGVGVPSLVDVKRGIVYDVQNIKSWKKVYLKDYLEKEFNIPVYVNNDANCFVMGEKHFGVGKNYKDIAGITLGTGFGTGLILNNKLYTGKNCGSGEFGSISYKNHDFEYYCSGQFFVNEYNMKGEEIFEGAEMGDEKSLKAFNEFGINVGEAVKAIMYAVDPELIVFGGSIVKAYKYFGESMLDTIKSFPYKKSLEKLKVEKSSLDNSAILGACALTLEKKE